MTQKGLGKHFVVLIIVIGAGYFLAPQEMEEGKYSSSFILDGKKVQDISFMVSSLKSSKTTTARFNISSTTFEITYLETYANDLGSKIWFSVRVFSLNADISKEYRERLNLRVEGSNEFAITLAPKYTGTIDFSFRVLRYSQIILPLLMAIAYLWLTELIPLSAASLIVPAVIIIFDIDTSTSALSPFFSKIIVLFFSGFLLAKAMQRVKLDEYLSLLILSKIPPNGNILLLILMSLTAFFSMFMSNTAAAAVLIPLSQSLLGKIDEDHETFQKVTVLGIAYAATMGGIGSLIGTPPNLMAVEFVSSYEGVEIGFLDWFFFGLPVMMVMIPIIYLYLRWKYKPTISRNALKETKRTALLTLKEHHKFSKDQWIVSIVFIGIVGFWLTEQFHNIHAGIIALIAAIVLFFAGQIQEEDVNSINWNVLLTFGGGISLGSIVLKSGLAEWFASLFISLKGSPIWLILLSLGIFALILTAFASNTASAAILIPIAMPIGNLFGLNPVTLAIYIAIVCSVDFAIVIGTPTTLLAYSTGMFKVKEIFQIGIILDLIGLILTWTMAALLFELSFQILFP